VEDDGPGLPPEPARILRGEPARDGEGDGDAGVGLANVRQRLELAYRGEAALDLREPAGGGCRLEIRLPLRSDDAGGGS